MKKKSKPSHVARKRSPVSCDDTVLSQNPHCRIKQKNRGNHNFSWYDTFSLLIIYLVMDVLMLVGFARFRHLFVVVLFIVAYLLQKHHKANLLWAWLLTLFSLLTVGVCRLFCKNEILYPASQISLMSTHQIEEIFSVTSLLWTLGLLAIVFSAYIYYVRKKDRALFTTEWFAALLNMLLFWGFMYLIFQNAS